MKSKLWLWVGLAFWMTFFIEVGVQDVSALFLEDGKFYTPQLGHIDCCNVVNDGVRTNCVDIPPEGPQDCGPPAGLVCNSENQNQTFCTASSSWYYDYDYSRFNITTNRLFGVYVNLTNCFKYQQGRPYAGCYNELGEMLIVNKIYPLNFFASKQCGINPVGVTNKTIIRMCDIERVDGVVKVDMEVWMDETEWSGGREVSLNIIQKNFYPIPLKSKGLDLVEPV